MGKKKKSTATTNLILRGKYVPFPPDNRVYAIGESVVYGNHDKSVITLVSDCKRFYSIHITNTRKHKFKDEYFDEEADQELIDWTKILPISSSSEFGEQISDDRWRYLSFSQQEVSSLLGRIYSYGVDFSPDYQRCDVWDARDKESLITSILEQRDIGKFVFNERPYSSTEAGCEIIDGKQRLTTIRDFYEDRFKYHGMLYSQMHPFDRMRIRTGTVNVATLNDASREDILRAFINVNTTGRQQSPDHLNKVMGMLSKEVAK
jgi:hypothetical protein